ncbi:MAG TPA: hypothetical protein VFO79_13330, partial [Xanthomonadales bacterium]|nr:hypothetical protein [Xanthomonadales bacterium]
MTPLAACAVWLVEALVIAALASRAAGARVALVLALGLLAYPFAVGGPAWIRLAFAIGAFWCVVRAADFALDAPPVRFGARLAHLFAIIDTRLVREGPRHLDGAALAKLLIALAVLVVAWHGVDAARPLDPVPRYALRWTAGALFFVASFEVATAAFALATQALGLHAPRVSDAPHRSLSIAEFWSARWNLVVG